MRKLLKDHAAKIIIPESNFKLQSLSNALKVDTHLHNRYGMPKTFSLKSKQNMLLPPFNPLVNKLLLFLLKKLL